MKLVNLYNINSFMEKFNPLEKLIVNNVCRAIPLILKLIQNTLTYSNVFKLPELKIGDVYIGDKKCKVIGNVLNCTHQ